MKLNITCQDCGKVLGTVEYKQPIGLAEAQSRASCYRCGECAAKKQQADAEAQADRAAAAERLAADAAKADTVPALRAVVQGLLTKVAQTEGVRT